MAKLINYSICHQYCNGYILQAGQELLNEEDRTLPA